MISVADPNCRNTLAVSSALVLIGRASQWWAIFFVFPKRAVGVIVTSLIGIDATIGKRSVAPALELRTQAGVRLAFHLIRTVTAIRFAITQQRRMNTMAVAALELTGHAGKSWAISWFIRTVPAVVLGVAPPPERDAFIGGSADELGRRAVVVAGNTIRSQDEILRTSALASSTRFQ